MTLHALNSKSVAARLSVAMCGFALLSSVAGCAIAGSSVKTVTTGTSAISTPEGRVHGGNQPVTGASIKLYAVGTPATGSGYGVGATPLLTSPVTTDGNGYFSISTLYTCPTPTTQVYIVASGGNPGLSGNNPNLAMMAALGPCPAGGNLLATIPFIDINEVTTVAAVWSLQQFMAAPATTTALAPKIGAPTTTYSNSTTSLAVKSGVIGLTNAFTTASVLAAVSNGQSPNPTYAAYATPETAKINTLADILAPCINSTGGVSGDSSACGTLFAAVMPSGSAFAPTDTIQAAWYMARYPINNVATLYNLVGGSPPFLPDVATGPNNAGGFNDTTVAINYAPYISGTTYALSEPYWVAIDAYGNAWVDNSGGAGPAAGVAELGADGSALIANTTGYTVSSTGGSISQFTTYGGTAPSGSALATTFNSPQQIAIDLNNNLWIANEAAVILTGTSDVNEVQASSVAEFFGSTGIGASGVGGSVTAPTGYTVGWQPYGLAVDASNNVWVSNGGSSTAVASSTVNAAIDGRSMSVLTAANGTYTWSTSNTTPVGNTAGDDRGMPGGTNFLAIDANLSGPFVWAAINNSCKTVGTAGETATTPWGIIQLFDDANAVSGPPLGDPTSATTAGSSVADATTSTSGAVAGASSNCGSSTPNIGQVFSALMSNPEGVAIDRNNGAWIVDSYLSGNGASGFDGLTYIPVLASGGLISGAQTTVAGAAGTTTNNPTPNAALVPTQLINGVAPASTAGTHGTTLNQPFGAAVDGNNNVWISNSTTAGSVAEATLCTNATAYGCSGYTGSTAAITLLTPGQGSTYAGSTYGVGFVHNIGTSFGVAVDPSGNVWVTNKASTSFTNAATGTTKEYNSVTVIVGAAGPVVTPLSLAIANSKLGQKP